MPHRPAGRGRRGGGRSGEGAGSCSGSPGGGRVAGCGAECHNHTATRVRRLPSRAKGASAAKCSSVAEDSAPKPLISQRKQPPKPAAVQPFTGLIVV
ncbi:hypothetical protein ENE75_12420 [Rubrivivax albus]|uniref:Uncharacterized protein n=1 Tax=Rubrivivax albus TaxID=2499835 RepID=A0A3S2VX95_9BURK|nr:hypothetical protein ENE75_12420 [Rubrivivax albus]